MTACELKPLSTQWLYENVPHADSWKMARDINGYTPLEALREKLEKMRTRKEKGFLRVVHVSDRFEGYPNTAVACLTLLSGQDALGLNNLCLRFGCSCGECVKGLLSARMRSSLILQGECHYDLLQEDIDDGGLWVNWNYSILEELEPDVRRNLRTNKSLRNGFANIFQIAAECLKAKIVPTVANLEWYSRDRSEWPPYTKSYLRRAGTQMGCRAVLRYMFDIAQEQDEYAGDGENQQILRKKWSELPTCRNDHEFEFVARVCGYGRENDMEDDMEDLISLSL
ncbi:uncharacterized protein N7511_009933 [Penicillium nucicola]|uniref:uncharacterized protein n=1 Tax=Penicillium nucicola TaxID=1850975 RepID=UPI0025455E26|nr:uncharacterized protein N7511_009933 [Penicillium nucicola]KAJ5748237.1 hypothetical protein N7511_009933 [Penicillium nucicola]